MSFWRKLFGIAPKQKDERFQQELSFRENIEALRTLPRFFVLIWETSPLYTLTNIILRLFKAALPITLLYVGKLIIDEVVRLSATSGQEDLSYLWKILIFEFALALSSDLISKAISLVDSLLGDLFANESSVRLMSHAAKLDLQQFEDSNFYDKLERARRQTTNRVQLMSQMLTQVQDIITIIFLGAGLFVFNPWLILLVLLAVLPIFFSETYFNKHSYSLARGWTPERRELDYLRLIGASDQTAKEVKIFGLADFLTQRFSKLADKYYLANKSLATRRAFWGGIFNSFGTIGYYGAFAFIILQTVKGELSLGDLTFLSGSFQRLQSSLQGILSRFSYIAQSALYLQDYFDFFEIEPQIKDQASSIPFPESIQDGFEFHNVGFKYPGANGWACRNINLKLKSGEKMALVGENGAGKTTLTKLISRLYDPTEGYITLDGKDIKSYKLEDLRKATGVIFQDFVKFQMKANENIAVGKIQNLDKNEQIEKASQLSLAEPVINNLPQKYEQMLGRRFTGGVELSGGEWQKVALGRAYMRDALLLILDEPTAALDARAEFEVFQRFSDLTAGKSALLISHRFSTVRMADRIAVLQNGQLIELGTHTELMNKDGYYAELFNLQAQGYR